MRVALRVDLPIEHYAHPIQLGQLLGRGREAERSGIMDRAVFTKPPDAHAFPGDDVALERGKDALALALQATIGLRVRDVSYDVQPFDAQEARRFLDRSFYLHNGLRRDHAAPRALASSFFNLCTDHGVVPFLD